MFEPRWMTTTGADGKKTKELKKKYIWRCDVLSMRTEQGLKQTKISFLMKTTSKKAEGRQDTRGQMAAGPPYTMVRASSSSDFDNFSGQLSSNVQPGSDETRLV